MLKDETHYKAEEYQHYMIMFETQNKALYDTFRYNSSKAMLGDDNALQTLENLIRDNTNVLDDTILQMMCNVYLNCLNSKL